MYDGEVASASPAFVATTAQPSKPLARLPLQIGTSATWNATGAALTLLPALALTVLPIAYLGEVGAVISLFVLLLLTLPFVIYGIACLVRSRRSRASDIHLDAGGIVVDGGPMHGRHIAWGELAPPFAHVEMTTEKRFRLGWLLLGALMFILFLCFLALAIASKGEGLGGAIRVFGTPWKRKEITIWRLWIITRTERIVAAVTDREIEAWSMQAAAESIEAVMAGRTYVEQAPAVAAQIVTCPRCGAPAVPDEAAAIACFYCRGTVPMPPHVRQQAAATRAMSASRVTSQKIVAKLLDQPRAASVNVRLLLLVLLMFFAWPIGWGVVAPQLIADGWSPMDAAFLALPFAAVLAAAFLARAPLADRGALQLLTLGFGALAPRTAGEPSRCRRCQGPLASAELGGVSPCRYCGADNIVGLDLRPTVGPARAEQATFDKALERRASEKTKWGILSVVAILALLGWIGGTAAVLAMDIVAM